MSPGGPRSWAGESFFLLLRVLALGASLGLFYSLEWHFLRPALCSSVMWALGLLGHSAVLLDPGISTILLAGDRVAVAITANCTYADLVLTLAPFCWRFQRGLGRNLLCLAAVAASVVPVNVSRLALAVHFALGGSRWALAHDAPDLILHHLIIAAAVLLALHSDRSFWQERRGSDPLAGGLRSLPQE